MMFGLALLCPVLVFRLSHALIENCSVDNSVCTSSDPPKLGVTYKGRKLACNDILQISDVTQRPTLTFDQGNEGDRYVLVFFDPDAPYPCAHSDGSSFLHYAAVVKLTGGELLENQKLVSYRGPHPPVATHRYQFYLFPWTSNQRPVLHNTDRSRSNFKLNQFQNDNHQNKPVAVFQLRVPHV